MGNQGDKQTVYCLAADTGKEVWKHTYDAPLDPNLYEGGPNATPTVDGDAVYTLSRQGHVHALAATDGKVVWSKNLTKELGLQVPDWGFSGSVLVHGDLLIIALRSLL